MVSGAVQIVDGEQIISVNRRNDAVGIFAILFELRHFLYTAFATQQGAVCMRLSREGLNEMLQKYPQDKEILMRNAFKQIASKTASTIRSNKSSKSKKSGVSKVSGKSGKSGKSKKSQNSGSIKKTSNAKDGAAEVADAKEEGEEAEEDKGSNAESGVQSNDIKSNGGSQGGSDDGSEGGTKIDMIKRQRRSEKLTIMLQAASLGDIDRVKTILKSGEVDINSVDAMNRTGMLWLLCMRIPTLSISI